MWLLENDTLRRDDSPQAATITGKNTIQFDHLISRRAEWPVLLSLFALADKPDTVNAGGTL
ncbi:MAG: hypothetical protein P0Y65_11430 [Candidatus Devosia phytovorans]|uniref:Uncharacterized protein n=1 Tax=Candidatus Devosia phytovorans TaxID=3121372 RepID=A0AAJ5VRE8_9HYPH|nr:hypothetical protein [Devosia sp.]WEK02821.1 MAG: hypothetical protein P0Y65_11430 [Devosia sp.]